METKILNQVFTTKTFVVPGPIPSKKNSRENLRNGRSFPSRKHQEWLKRALESTISEKRYIHTSLVEIVLYSENMRKFDIDNKTSSIFDMLVKAGVLVDDNNFVVPYLMVRFAGIDPNRPRAEVKIVGQLEN